MKLGILLAASFLLVFVAVACGEAEAPSPEATGTVAGTPSPVPTETPAGPSPTPVPTAVPNVCQANPSPVNPADPNIVVQSPQPGEAVASPFLVSGLARVFEAQVSLTLYGELGGVIAETQTLAAEGGVLSPFEAELTFAVSREQPACLWVFQVSAEDGSSVDVVQVPLALVPPAQPDATVTRTASPMSAPSQ